MPFIPAVNTAKVSVVQFMHNQTIMNIFHVRKATAWSAPELVTLSDEFIEWWNTDLAPNVSTDLTLLRVQARDMTTEDALGVEVSAPALSGGDVASPGLPGNAALAVKHKTGFIGRNRNGRTFLSGLAENQVNGNEILAAQRDNIISAFEALRGRMVAADQELVIASFYDGTELELQPNGETVRVPQPRATALLTPILSFAADTQLDSQRRRLAGRGV